VGVEREERVKRRPVGVGKSRSAGKVYWRFNGRMDWEILNRRME